MLPLRERLRPVGGAGETLRLALAWVGLPEEPDLISLAVMPELPGLQARRVKDWLREVRLVKELEVTLEPEQVLPKATLSLDRSTRIL